jgi:hypothetical protein
MLGDLAYPISDGDFVSGCKLRLEEARENFPELITLVERGEAIAITRDEIPFADLMPSLAREG